MPNHTPPRRWDDGAQARKWLTEFVMDAADYKSWTIGDLDDLYDETLIKVRRGWRTGIVLKKPFRRNPDALLTFAEEFRAKKREQD